MRKHDVQSLNQLHSHTSAISLDFLFMLSSVPSRTPILSVRVREPKRSAIKTRTAPQPQLSRQSLRTPQGLSRPRSRQRLCASSRPFREPHAAGAHVRQLLTHRRYCNRSESKSQTKMKRLPPKPNKLRVAHTDAYYALNVMRFNSIGMWQKRTDEPCPARDSCLSNDQRLLQTSLRQQAHGVACGVIRHSDKSKRSVVQHLLRTNHVQIGQPFEIVEMDPSLLVITG